MDRASAAVGWYACTCHEVVMSALDKDDGHWLVVSRRHEVEEEEVRSMQSFHSDVGFQRRNTHLATSPIDRSHAMKLQVPQVPF